MLAVSTVSSGVIRNTSSTSSGWELLGLDFFHLSKMLSFCFLFPRHFFPPCHFYPHLLLWHSKSGDLEEELKNVTNNLKSLEAQAEKVGEAATAGGCVTVKRQQSLPITEALSGTVQNQKACLQHNIKKFLFPKRYAV